MATGRELAEEDRQEVRIALVMTGGVSLAIWMGGASYELNRLTQRKDPTYSSLLDLTGSTARVDVISGTSAGGLNGALLATATAHGSDLSGLRGLWLDKGALENLLRPPLSADPPSLLRGDDFFLPAIKDALTSLEGSLEPVERAPVHLIITATLLHPRYRGTPDAFGSMVHDVDHRAEFTFRRGDTAHHRPGCSHQSALDLRDDFAETGTTARLALAARTSASFPFAFEASFCPIGDEGEDAAHPDMGCHANFEIGRFAIDGGVLANKPLGPALRAVFAEPADKDVRRVVAYMVPDPGEALQDKPDDAQQVPSIAQVGIASLLTAPRNQSVRADLEQLIRHNSRVSAQRRQREFLLETTDLETLASELDPHYREQRAQRLAEDVVATLAQGLTDAQLESRRPEAADCPMWDGDLFRAALLEELSRRRARGLRTVDEQSHLWFATADAVERSAQVVLDLVRRGLRVVDPHSSDAAAVRAGLGEVRGQVDRVLAAVRSQRPALDRRRGMEFASRALVAAKAGGLDSWAREAVELFLGQQEAFRDLSRQVVKLLFAATELAAAASDHRAPQLREPAEALSEMAARLASRSAPEMSAHEEAQRRLFALEVVQTAVATEPAVLEQPMELLQMSADSANGLDPRRRPSEKLAGLALGHFGAFYKRSWRANDWMWGRMDAAQRLTQMVLNPARLRQLGLGIEEALKGIEAIALDGDEEGVLAGAGPRPWSRETAREELSFLEDASLPLPKALPVSAQAIARRMQLRILVEELPCVADAIRYDERDGAHESTDARHLAASITPGGEPSAREAVKLLRRCHVGTEGFRDEVESGSELFARTTSKTSAVGASVLGGRHAGLGDRAQHVRAVLRGLGLAFYLLVRNALSGSRWGATVVTAALVAGATLVAVALLATLPGILLILGVTLIAGGLAVAFVRRRAWTAILPLLGALLVALGPRIVGWIYDAVQDDEPKAADVWRWIDRVEPLVVVIALGIGAWCLGLVVTVRRTKAPAAPQVPTGARNETKSGC